MRAESFSADWTVREMVLTFVVACRFSRRRVNFADDLRDLRRAGGI